MELTRERKSIIQSPNLHPSSKLVISHLDLTSSSPTILYYIPSPSRAAPSACGGFPLDFLSIFFFSLSLCERSTKHAISIPSPPIPKAWAKSTFTMYWEVSIDDNLFFSKPPVSLPPYSSNRGHVCCGLSKSGWPPKMVGWFGLNWKDLRGKGIGVQGLGIELS